MDSTVEPARPMLFPQSSVFEGCSALRRWKSDSIADHHLKNKKILTGLERYGKGFEDPVTFMDYKELIFETKREIKVYRLNRELPPPKHTPSNNNELQDTYRKGEFALSVVSRELLTR